VISNPVVLKYIALAAFLGAYISFVRFPNKRMHASLVAALIVMVSGVVSVANALWSGDAHGEGPLVNWNVMGVFFGTLVLAELFMYSQAPEVLAEKLLGRFHSPRWAMVALCLFGGIISMFVENVAAVLILAPIAISVARKAEQPLTPVMIGLVLQSNLHGCGTMIGDPPDMLLAGYTKMNFNDFIWFHGRPSLFFSVIAGSLCGSAYLAYAYRHLKGSITFAERTKVLSWLPTIFLGVLILGLAFSSLVDPNFSWAAGSLCMLMAFVGVLWYLARLKQENKSSNEVMALLKKLDWDTGFFLVGIFIFVGGFTHYWVNDIANVMSSLAGGSLVVAFIIIVLSSMTASAFIDNVPFLLAMLPVTEALGSNLGLTMGTPPMFFLFFGLLIGASVGGNITPIGATANVVAIGILKREGEPVRFQDYIKMGLPFSIIATAAACFFLFLFWSN
jgi:Na+/H+ antiporter NhaD/arsenite permease-like protein